MLYYVVVIIDQRSVQCTATARQTPPATATAQVCIYLEYVLYLHTAPCTYVLPPARVCMYVIEEKKLFKISRVRTTPTHTTPAP